MKGYAVSFLAVISSAILLSGCGKEGANGKFPINEKTSPAAIAEAKKQTMTDSRESGRKIKLELLKTYRSFSAPTAVAIDAAGNLYVSNWGGGTVTKIDAAGNRTEFIGGLGSPAGLAFDGAGNLYIADYSRDVIYRATRHGEKSVFLKSGLKTPTGISFDQNESLLIANRGNDEILRADSEGKITAAYAGMSTPVGVAADAAGNIFVTNYGGTVKKIGTEGKCGDFSAAFARPGVGIAVLESGEVFAVDNGGDCVRQIFPDGTSRIIIGNIGGCVGLASDKNILYVTSWDAGAVYAYALVRQ